MASLRQVEIWRIEALIPDVTEAMIDEFLERESVSITTLRIWTWQDAIAIQDGKLCKVKPSAQPYKSIIEVMLKDAARLSHG